MTRLVQAPPRPRSALRAPGAATSETARAWLFKRPNEGMRPKACRWKRGLDLSLIFITTPIWLPVMGVVAIMIRLLSGSPVLFRQERIGLGGRRFVCFKFRTMRVGADTSRQEQYLAELMASGRPMTKLDGHDSRLIPLAGILRATGLDELPQLLNVLRGEMSLVGPRPEEIRVVSSYSAWHFKRLMVKPGMTGPMQVYGRSELTFEERLALERDYLDNLSIGGDLAILLRTPSAIIRGDGAY